MKDDNQFIKSVSGRTMITSMLAVLGSILGQVATNIIIGNALGSDALSVTGVLLPLYYVFATVGALLGVGGMTVCANRIGGGDDAGASRVFSSVYLLTAAIAAALTTVLLPNLDRVLGLLGVVPGDGIYPDVRSYAVVMVWGGVFTMGIYPAFNLLRLDGRNTASAMIFFVMAGVTILLDFVFLYVLDWGMFGVSLAASAGAAAASLTGAFLLFFRSRNFRLVSPFRGLWASVRSIFAAGSPSAAENLCILLRTLFLNLILLAGFGVTALSAYNVTNSLNSFALVFISGISGAMIPFIGVFAEEKDTASIRQLLRLAFRRGLVLTGAFTLLCLLLPGPIAGAFGMGGQAELAAARPAVLLFSLSFLPALINNILICLHQAMRRPALANILTVLRSLFLVTALAWGLSPRFGLNGVWNSFWIAELVTLAAAILLSLPYRRRNPNLSPVFLLDTEAEREGSFVCFSVENRPEAVVECAEKITEFCERNGLAPRRSMAISLSLEEMLTSICQHSLGSRALKMSVRILILRDVAVLRIRNQGAEFNPIRYCEQKRAEVGGALDQLDDSMGIQMIVKLADVVDYRRTFGVNNLTIIL